jgi:hypothetical protein
MGYTSGGDWVDQSDFSSVLDILAGRSPWQSYILPNLKIAKASRRSFSVLPENQFRERTKLDVNDPGVTFKQTGDIIMLQWGAAGRTYLSAVLHESVHLVSHPPNQGQPHSTAMAYLGEGLLEGLVEVVTEDILKAQSIALAPAKMRGHQERVPIVRELIKTAGIPIFARALFQGWVPTPLERWREHMPPPFRGRGMFWRNNNELTWEMQLTYSPDGWNIIKALATAKQTTQALHQMVVYRQRQEQRRSATATGRP